MEAKKDFKQELMETCKAIGRPGHGILAADESTGTIGQRFAKIDTENNEENRRFYRELLFTTPTLEEHISGVIMFEETLDQKTADGVNFVELLKSRGIIPGIKVDKGVVVIGGTKNENATQGLDGLAARCKEFYGKGCRFAKWRAVLKINEADGLPSQVAITENAHILARYASICQDNGLAPIVEPEILVDGTHSIEVCAEASERVFSACMKALIDQKCIIEGLLLKPNMITPGTDCPDRKSAQEIAWYTVRTLSRTIVPSLPAIVFLSGGQSEEEASENLSQMNKLDVKRPWSLTFSYGRALQSSCLKAWMGKTENKKAAQEALLVRAKANGAASMGKYVGGSGESESLHVKNYVY
jgi:fructose-bisphosphate aldolase class I